MPDNRTSFEPIAIIGSACLLPGARSPAELYAAAAAGADLITAAPEGHWRIDPALVLTWQELAGRVVAQDPAVELARLRSRFDALADRIRAVDRNLSNRDFVTRAPPEIVARQRECRDGLADALTKLRRNIECLEEDGE